MKVLVTGGAGFIGSHLVDALVAQDHQVRVLDNLTRGRMELIETHLVSRQVEFMQGDVRDVEAVRTAAQGMQVVFHLAAQSNVLGALVDLDYSFTANVVGTFNLLKTARAVGAQRVVFTSSREVYGEARHLPVDEAQPLRAKNAYGASKIAAEAYCNVLADIGMDVAVLRLANVYGPRDRDRVIPIFIGNALQGQALTLYGGDQVIDFVWIGYVVRALLAAGLNNDWPVQQPINVGSGVGTSIRELAERVRQATETRVSIEMAPARSPEVTRFVADVSRLRALMLTSDLPDPLGQLPLVVNYWKGYMGRSDYDRHNEGFQERV